MRRPATRGTWLWVHLATLALAVPVLVWINRDQWFSGDEWGVITTNGLGANPQTQSIFAPHFEHWTTVPILVFRALYAMVAMRSYWPYVAVLIVVQLVVAHLLWRLLLRVGVQPGFATAVAATFVVMAIGWENVSTAWQITIIAPIALGFAALLVLPEDDSERTRFGRRDIAVWALLVVGIMCSGTGVTMAIVVGIAALLRRGWKLALADVSVPAVVYLVWYVTWGTEGQRNQSSTADAIKGLPGFVWRGVTDAIGGFFRVDLLGPVVLVLLLAWLVWRATPRLDPWPLVLACSAGAILGNALTGIRRAGTDGGASRYAYVVVVLLLPALALALQDVVGPFVRRHGRPVAYAVAAVLVAFTVVQVVGLNDEVSNEIFVGEMRPRTLGTAVLLRDRQPVIADSLFGIIAEPSPKTIARLEAQGDLPSLDSVDHDDVLTAAEYVQMTVDGPGAEKYPVAGGACRTLSRADDFPLTEASSLPVTTAHTGNFTVQFRDARGAGEPRPVYAVADQAVVLNIARRDVQVRLVPVAGSTLKVCGLRG